MIAHHPGGVRRNEHCWECIRARAVIAIQRTARRARGRRTGAGGVLVKVDEDEQRLLRSAALSNAESILMARQRAERELLATKDELERTTAELREVRARLEHTLAAAEIGTWNWDVRKNQLMTDPN